MKKIKIKVKYIIYLAMTILLIIPNMIIGGAAMAYNYDVKNTGNIDEIPKGYYFQGLLNFYVNMPKISPFNDVAYYYMGVNEYNYKTSPVTFGVNVAMGSNGNVYFNDEGIENAIEHHKKGMENVVSNNYYIKNMNALMGLYFEIGDFSSAQKLVDELKYSENDLMRSYAWLNEGAMYIKQEGYDEAIKSFENMDIEEIVNKNAYIGDAYKLKGDNEKANEYYMHDYIVRSKNLGQQTDYKENLSLPYMNKELSQTMNQLNSIENVYENIIPNKYRGSIDGKFIYNGIPMVGATIYLSKEEILYFGNPGEIDVSSNRESIYAYVQEDGSFRFNNIPEGKYYVSIAIPRSKYVQANVAWSYINDNFVKVDAQKTSKMKIIKKLDEDDKESFYIECDNINYENLLKYDENPEKYGYFGEALADEDMIIFKGDKGGKDEFPAKVAQMSILEQNDELEFYKMFSDDPSKGSFEDKFLFKNLDYKLGAKEYIKAKSEDERDKFVEGAVDYEMLYYIEEKHGNLFEDIITEDEARIFFPVEVIGYLRGKNVNYYAYMARDYKDAYRYYEKKYEENKKDIMTLQILIKFYVTGYDYLSGGKDVAKALELSDKLYELVGSKSADIHLKEYIIRSYSRVLTTEYTTAAAMLGDWESN